FRFHLTEVAGFIHGTHAALAQGFFQQEAFLQQTTGAAAQCLFSQFARFGKACRIIGRVRPAVLGVLRRRCSSGGYGRFLFGLISSAVFGRRGGFPAWCRGGGFFGFRTGLFGEYGGVRLGWARFASQHRSIVSFRSRFFSQDGCIIRFCT